MRIENRISKLKGLLFVCLCFIIFGGCTAKGDRTIKMEPSESVTMENDTLKVVVDGKSGCFSVTEKISGQVWSPDPWENAAGILTLSDSKGKEQSVSISKSKKIEVLQKGKNTVTIKFMDPILADGTVANGVVIGTEIALDSKISKLDVRVTEHQSGKFGLLDLRYPSRHFSLKTDEDKGAAVIPENQGIICPSYIFPMNGGRFCKWDDATYDRRTIGTMPLYGFTKAISMPWWGTYNEKSAVVGILNESSKAEMFYNINNNGQYMFDESGRMSPYRRIEFLDPSWKLNNNNEKKEISYHFIPGGDYVDMAKQYRREAKNKGYFLSLNEKAKRNPNINKLAGSIYIGIYGGYPHYVNMPGMAFTFDQLKEIIRDTHDNLKVKNAFIHAWGTFSNYVPNDWPISDALGGTAKLKEAVDLAKKYGYLYSSYHAYSPILENDPHANYDLMEKGEDGKFKKIKGRWARVDPKYYKELAEKTLPKEIDALGLEANITDILFIQKPNPGTIELAKYLDSLNLVNATEHGQEQYIPYLDMFEGMTYNGTGLLKDTSIKAPLFNLVYHDAIAVFNKIQDPDNEVSDNGDFQIKTLRNILFGIGTNIFFAPYEFDGMKNRIKIANELVSPVHKETFFSELVGHEYLSPDFKVQRTQFSNGTKVLVNMGLVDQKIEDGTFVPGYGYRITGKDGNVKSGHYNLGISVD